MENNEALLEAFWVRARNVARFNPLEVIVGADDTSALRPAAFAFGRTPESADELCELVVAGKKTATSSWLACYEAEGVDVPRVGELAIVCDGSDEPRALIRVREVRTVPFGAVDVEISDAEGEGTLEKWIADHTAFFAEECEQTGIEFDPSQSVVIEFFEVLYSR